VHESIHEQFISKMTEGMSKFVIGNGMEEATTQGPLINQSQFSKVFGLGLKCADIDPSSRRSNFHLFGFHTFVI
jgi:hypothetical protein